MAARIAFAFVLLLSPAAASAMDCDPSRLVYVGQDDPGTEIRYDGNELIYTSEGKSQRLGTMGGGTGIAARTATNPHDPAGPGVVYFQIDILEYASPGAPDHLLIFHNSVFVPECR